MAPGRSETTPSHLIPTLLFLASTAFPLGLVLPLMRLEKLFLFEETPSLLQLIAGLHDAGDWLLAAIVALFSLAFPAAKLFLVFLVAFGAQPVSRIRLISALGKWSMMDVMLVAIVIFAAKTGGIAAALTLPGLWFFAAATALTALAAFAIERNARAIARRREMQPR